MRYELRKRRFGSPLSMTTTPRRWRAATASGKEEEEEEEEGGGGGGVGGERRERSATYVCAAAQAKRYSLLPSEYIQQDAPEELSPPRWRR